MKKCILGIILYICSINLYASPVDGLLERIDKGASKKFRIEKIDSDKEFFELDQKGSKVVVRGNNYVNIASGIHWYLKYYAGIHLSWNGMKASLPEVLPPVREKERRETDKTYRYAFNYCTYSYTMAFWDWNRWEQEIDWMALHGINMPLAVVGADVVWHRVLKRLGYTKTEIDEFIAGPAFQAWWLMNNLEGWGGPNPDSWYGQRLALQKKILKRMREYGIKPVLPGYSGMLPHNAKEKLGLDVADPGRWCGYRRPAFLQPTDKHFSRIASIYYEELTRLYGKADFYSMDPFHEGGSVEGVDLAAAGKAIRESMKKVNPKAVWVAQAWQACPHEKMIEAIPAGDLIVLDLFSESRPQWGDEASSWFRKDGFKGHDWLYCMLLNYGGNVGLHGKMQHVIDEYFKANNSPFGNTLKGTGMTMEGSENNPVMFELLSELVWRPAPFRKEDWLDGYIKARYGTWNPALREAWTLLGNSIYNCPASSTQQGTHESVFCARPSLEVYQVSSWSEMQDYYQPMDVIKAAGKMMDVADAFRGNNNFEYDLVDVLRQAVAEKGRLVYKVVVDAFIARDRKLFFVASNRFLELILLQDKLLATRKEFRLGGWLHPARRWGTSEAEKDWCEWNARVQITTWGNRTAAEQGGLRDYAHKEWNGLLRDFYYMRWKTYFSGLADELNGVPAKPIDFYALEEAWTLQQNPYSEAAEGNPVDVAKEVYREAFE